MSRTPHRRLVAPFLAATVLGFTATPAVAVTRGRARIEKADGSGPLNAGGSTTPYAVALPVGAACPGDTAHRGYRVWSYLAPKATDPGTISLTGILPTPGLALVANGEVFGPANTAINTGDIVGVPNSFTFVRVTPSDLFPGGQSKATWEAGIACADVHGSMTRYWNVELSFSASTSDPGGFTWRVVQPASTRRHLNWGWPVLGAAIALGGGLWWSFRRTPRPHRAETVAAQS